MSWSSVFLGDCVLHLCTQACSSTWGLCEHSSNLNKGLAWTQWNFDLLKFLHSFYQTHPHVIISSYTLPYSSNLCHFSFSHIWNKKYSHKVLTKDSQLTYGSIRVVEELVTFLARSYVDQGQVISADNQIFTQITLKDQAPEQSLGIIPSKVFPKTMKGKSVMAWRSKWERKGVC